METEVGKRDAQSAVARKPEAEPLATTLTWVSRSTTYDPLGLAYAPPKLFSHDSRRESTANNRVYATTPLHAVSTLQFYFASWIISITAYSST
ncbi:MAG: hypothetical protein K2K94_03345 [Muribaculaceae bacterium]|nr:hypothetical protein [Muribaculaceae bacterium]